MAAERREKEQLILFGIFALALVLRIAHLHEIRANDPFFTLPEVDGREYHDQALAISRGDLIGEGATILGPLYPGFMAIVYALFGPSFFVLKLLQAVLGAVDCLLVYWLARLHFDAATALLAATGTAVYTMLVFYGGTVMQENILVPLVLLCAIQVTRALREPSLLRWAVAGALVAAGALARQDLLLFGACVLGWLLWALRERATPGRRAAYAAVFAASIALLILPFSVRNWMATNDFVLLNSTGGINLYMGNSGRANGAWVPPNFGNLRVDSPRAMQHAFRVVAEGAVARELRPSEVSSYWRDRAIEWITENPAKWLRLELRKFLLFWNAREVWNNQSIEISREFSWVLRTPLLGFAVVAPLALLGLGLASSRFAELFPMYALVAVFLATGLLLFVLARYRIGVVPILLIFAAYAATTLLRGIRGRRLKELAPIAGWLLILTALVRLDLGKENLYMAWFNLGNKYRQLGRYEQAIEAYDRSLALDPNFIGTHNNLALAYEGAGHTEDAIDRWREVFDRAQRKGDAVRIERAERHLRSLHSQPAERNSDDPMTPAE
jgi:4-amino-4-deoxy-L-arabinose transferase-like glycosyltransferase